jgi:hypothetical protein
VASYKNGGRWQVDRSQRPIIDCNSFKPLSLTGSGGVVAWMGNKRTVATMGEGGMGTVFKAKDRELDRVVALKVIRSEMRVSTVF